MTHIQATIDIKAPRDRVCAAVRDIELWPAWNPKVMRVRPLDTGPLTFGSRTIVRQSKLLSARWQITDFEKARHSVEGAGSGNWATLSLNSSCLLGALSARLTRCLTALSRCRVVGTQEARRDGSWLGGLKIGSSGKSR